MTHDASFKSDFNMLWISSVLAVVVAGSAVGNDVNPMPSPEGTPTVSPHIRTYP